jgi:hypothetical protein
MCCLLWLHVLEYFFNSPTHPTYEAGISDVLLFVITCVRVQQSHPHPTYEAGIEWCVLWLHVLEYFSTVLPNLHLWSRGLSDVLLFVITCVRSTVPPIPTYEAGIEWCAALCDSMC